MTTDNPLKNLGQDAKDAAGILAHTTLEQKNAFLKDVATLLRQEQDMILQANAQDMSMAEKSGLSPAMLDRLKLDAARLESIAKSVETIITLPDPVGGQLDSITRPNGLTITKIAVPLGVIGVIFEARPNVAIDAAALCLKAGNACILRGGKDSFGSVAVLTNIMRRALKNNNLPENAVQTIPSADRALVGAMLQLDDYIDVIVPRGGKELIARVRNESRVPVFSHLDGICHTYIDKDADPQKALEITLNAKMRRTGICGATECLLLHQDIARTIGKTVIDALIAKDCTVKVPSAYTGLNPACEIATDSDYGCEFLAPVLAVQIVASEKEAVDFINRNGSQHTDAIITENGETARYFLKRVNSAIAMHNASTQFADGGEFGMGAEIGIATGKLHARGPVGLNQLVTYQYQVHGNGQVRA
ncbi:MAG TPA: glutamate-5-semialdehyde dehydrogenase [Alphaproteobacteria bacterium]